MFILGCDLHARLEHIAMLDPQTGERIEGRFEHENGEARIFDAALEEDCGRLRQLSGPTSPDRTSPRL